MIVSRPATHREPERFSGPAVFTPDHADNLQVAFGHAIHHCRGTPPARLDGRIAIGAPPAGFPWPRLEVPAGNRTGGAAW
ncbi:hypothetical protein ALI22I_14980 [Saccharothrix sp. ALI-22-I]|nr:hypothetical protein ALI22I_14980 [Saccharothrix sp. ALI-22-I]